MNKTDRTTIGNRAKNFLIDYIILTLLSYFLFFILIFATKILFPKYIDIYKNVNVYIDYAVLLILYFLYYFLFELITGKTLAKYFTKTKVVMEDDSNITPKAIFIRSITRLIPFEPISYFWMNGTGWHDKFSKTKVIDI